MAFGTKVGPCVSSRRSNPIVRTLPDVRVRSGKVRRNETVTLRPADEEMIRQALNVDLSNISS